MQMVRLVIAAAVSGLLFTACAPKESAPAPDASPAATPATAAPAAATPAPETRIGTMQLSCAGESFRVAFEDQRAVVVNPDGSNTELARNIPADMPMSGQALYTDGKLTFTKEGGGDKPTVIKFARGRMAFQDCAIAQN
jgi:hypothetical protein